MSACLVIGIKLTEMYIRGQCALVCNNPPPYPQDIERHVQADSQRHTQQENQQRVQDGVEQDAPQDGPHELLDDVLRDTQQDILQGDPLDIQRPAPFERLRYPKCDHCKKSVTP